MVEKNEQSDISFKDVWGEQERANIISGKIAPAICIGFLNICNDEKTSAHSLVHIMQAMANRGMNEEVLRLLEIICDIADIDYPLVPSDAIAAPSEADALVQELVFDFDEILEEETM